MAKVLDRPTTKSTPQTEVLPRPTERQLPEPPAPRRYSRWPVAMLVLAIVAAVGAVAIYNVASDDAATADTIVYEILREPYEIVPAEVPPPYAQSVSLWNEYLEAEALTQPYASEVALWDQYLETKAANDAVIPPYAQSVEAWNDFLRFS